MTNTLYKVNPGDKPLASDVDQLVDTLNGVFDVGSVTLAAPMSVPSTASTAAVAVAGSGLSVGTYLYKFTYVAGYVKSNGTFIYGSETNGSAEISVTTTAGNQQVNVTGIPTVWPTSAVALRIYRTAVGGASGTEKLVTTITTPTASYSDTTADASLGAAIPTTNTTGTKLTLGADPTAALEAATKGYVDSAVGAIQLTAANVSIADTAGHFTSTDVEGALAELFQNVSDGKVTVAAAITAMNQVANGSMTFAQLAAAIQAISTDANAGVSDVLAPQTFYQGGVKRTGTLSLSGNAGDAQVLSAYTYYNTDAKTKRTGTMPNRGAPTWTPGTTNQSLSAGYYSGGTIYGDADLVAPNILDIANIFGVQGTAQKRLYATGTATSSSSLNGFAKVDGYPYNSYQITVTGLAFSPKVVVVWYANANVSSSIYSVDATFQTGSFQPAHCMLMNSQVNPMGIGLVDYGGLGVTADGFTLPAYIASTVHNWLAFG